MTDETLTRSDLREILNVAWNAALRSAGNGTEIVGAMMSELNRLSPSGKGETVPCQHDWIRGVGELRGTWFCATCEVSRPECLELPSSEKNRTLCYCDGEACDRSGSKEPSCSPPKTTANDASVDTTGTRTASPRTATTTPADSACGSPKENQTAHASATAPSRPDPIPDPVCECGAPRTEHDGRSFVCGNYTPARRKDRPDPSTEHPAVKAYYAKRGGCDYAALNWNQPHQLVAMIEKADALAAALVSLAALQRNDADYAKKYYANWQAAELGKKDAEAKLSLAELEIKTLMALLEKKHER